MGLRNSIRRTFGGWILAAGTVAPALFHASPVAAQSTQMRFDIPAGDLGSALSALAARANIQLVLDPALTQGKTTRGLQGNYSVDEAIASLLAGSGLERVVNESGVNTLRATSSAAATLSRIVVEGEEDEEPGIRAETQEGATKMALSIRETPQAISVITRESIELRQSLDISSAIELSAGVAATGKAFAGNNPRTGEDFYLRGQELEGSRDIRIDGFTAGGNRNNFDLAPFERVEVVKGPSSMLYGQGSLGGFINLVRRKPQAERKLEISAQIGSYDTYRTDINVAGALNDSESLLGQATLAYEDSESFISDVTLQRFVFAPGVQWSPRDGTRVRAEVLYQDDKFSPSLGIPLRQVGSELVAPAVSRSFFFGVPSTEDSKASGFHATVTTEQDLSDRWLATLVLHHSRNRLLGLADSYGYGIDDYGNTTLYSSYVAHDHDNWAGELRLDGRFDAFGREHRLLVGAEKNKHDFVGWGGGGYPYIGTANIYDGSLETAATVPALDNPKQYDARDDGSTEGVYSQLLLSVRDRTRLLLGARYERTQSHSVIDGAGGLNDDQQDDNKLTGGIGLTQDFGQSLTGYAVYAESFNPVFELSRTGGLDPETGEGYEVGLKGEWMEGRFGATAAVFRQELDNRPIPDPDNGPGESFSISGGLQRSEGVELEATGRPLAGLTISAAASWLDAEYIDALDVDNFGKTPGGTIKRQFALFSRYELQDGALRGLGFGATLLSVGDRIVLSGDNLTVKGYERLDLHLSYRAIPSWNLSLLVRNVADEKYIERPNSAYLYGHFYGAPRSVMFRAEYSAP